MKRGVVAVIAGLLLLEGFAWLIAPKFTLREIVSIADDGSYTLRPGAKVLFEGHYEKLPTPVTWEVNLNGLRGHDLVPMTPTKFRIATFGDSEVFGWAVNETETFQQRMEVADPSLDVVNFGVPGYNAENVAAQAPAVVKVFEPRLCLFLLNPNDAEPAPRITPALQLMTKSALMRILQFAYVALIEAPREMKRRASPDARARFLSHVTRVRDACADHDVPMMLVLLNERDRDAAPEGVDVLSVESLLAKETRIDHHLTASAYDALARELVSHVRH